MMSIAVLAVVMFRPMRRLRSPGITPPPVIVPATGDFRLDGEPRTTRLGAAIAGALKSGELLGGEWLAGWPNHFDSKWRRSATSPNR